MSGFLRLIGFTKVVAVVGATWTACCVLLLFGWQAKTFYAEGVWPILPISTVVQALGQGATYVPASIDEIARRPEPSLGGAMSECPAIVLLLVGLAMLIAFYLWLSHIERRYSRDF